MKMYLLMLFFVACFSLQGQTLNGTVYDENKQPLPGVSVYLDGTTIYTITDAGGNYAIATPEKVNSSLVISFIGYSSVIVANPFENNNQKVYLTVKIESLKEVVITKDYFTRKQKLKIFREYFLGRTAAGKTCTIENEDDIDFVYDYKTNTLTASSDRPLRVNNPYLGYKIEFTLYEFTLKFYEKSLKSDAVIKSLFLGTAFFKDVARQNDIFAKRDKVYYGSSMQFFKNLTNKIWDKRSFLLFKNKFQINPDSFFKVEEIDGLKKVSLLKNEVNEVLISGLKPKFYASAIVLYDKDDQSQIIFRTESFYVDFYGNNSNIQDIEYSGEMSTKKMGDLLPLNFVPTVTKD